MSVEELSPGSLCDLTSRRRPLISLLAPSPALSPLPALCRENSGWPGRDGLLPWPPYCSLVVEEGGVGEGEEAGTPAGHEEMEW